MLQRPVLVTLDNITRFHGDRLIFKQISASFTESSINLLAGENGAGKSTLLQIIAGILAPSSGKVYYADNKQPNIALLGHQPAIYPNLTAWENLQFWGQLHQVAVPAAFLDELLERMRLSPFAHDKAKNFSRGMMQRLNLARVFLTKPSIILLDEPATGLDQPSTQLLYDEIQQAKINGCCIIWISHFLQHDLPHADTVMLLAEKKLAFSGPATLFTKSFSSKTLQRLSQQQNVSEATAQTHLPPTLTDKIENKKQSGIVCYCNLEIDQTQKAASPNNTARKNTHKTKGISE